MRTSDPRLVPKFGSFTPNGWILCGTLRNSTLDRLDLDCLNQTFKQRFGPLWARADMRNIMHVCKCQRRCYYVTSRVCACAGEDLTA